MLRLNRGRIIGLALTGFIIYFLFLSSTNSPGDFRRRTEEGLSRRHGILQGDISDEAYRAQTNAKLNEVLAQQQQKPVRASDEGAGPKKGAEDDETTVAGRKTMQKPAGKDREQPKYPKDAAQDSLKEKNKGDDADGEKERKKVVADPARDIAREKLQEYLKKPIVIFSKSPCPHSKRAKELLLSVYKITPTPLVVELDQLTERLPAPPRPQPQPHEPHADADDTPPPQAPTLGQKIQEILGEITGRRTVPNIIVGGTKSIGGNDLIWEMHEEGSLKEKILALGGKRIVGFEEVDLAEGTRGR